jgi:hypothetical protein
LCERRRHVHAPVFGRERPEPPGRLLELPLATDAVAARGLVPGDRDMDEALEEVLLRRVGGAPRELELLVGGEELAAADQPEPALEVALKRRRRP